LRVGQFPLLELCERQQALGLSIGLRTTCTPLRTSSNVSASSQGLCCASK
jgi:hypothetical protein